MADVQVSLKRLADKDLELPSYQTGGAAGMDLAAAVNEAVTLGSGEFRLIPCGFSLAIPEGFEAQVRPRSGLASRFGVTVLNAPGTIDADYRGEVGVILINHGPHPFVVKRGDRVAQLIVAPVARVQWDVVETLPATARGAGGFGHTGQ
jgi:dUTP pyrophosphatase